MTVSMTYGASSVDTDSVSMSGDSREPRAAALWHRPSSCPPVRVMPRLSASGSRRPPESSPSVAGGSSCISRERPSRLPAGASRPRAAVRSRAAGFLLGFAALLALPLQAEAQTTYVSNIGQADNASPLATSDWDLGQGDRRGWLYAGKRRHQAAVPERCFGISHTNGQHCSGNADGHSGGDADTTGKSHCKYNGGLYVHGSGEHDAHCFDNLLRRDRDGGRSCDYCHAPNRLK